jgi:predicted nuclease of predicted toxin-antitoxin system
VRVLFDHNLPRRFRYLLPNHEVHTTREMGWEEFENGVLLNAAAKASFDVFVSVDKNIEYEQNLLTLPLPVAVVNAPSNALAALLPFAPFLLELLDTSLDRLLYVIEPTGTVLRLTTPRRLRR